MWRVCRDTPGRWVFILTSQCTLYIFQDVQLVYDVKLQNSTSWLVYFHGNSA